MSNLLMIHDKYIYIVIDVKMKRRSIDRKAGVQKQRKRKRFRISVGRRRERAKPTPLSINKEDRIKGLENGLNSSYEHAGGLGTESNVTIVKPMSCPARITRVKRRIRVYHILRLTSRSSLIFKPPLPIMHPAWL